MFLGLSLYFKIVCLIWFLSLLWFLDILWLFGFFWLLFWFFFRLLNFLINLLFFFDYSSLRDTFNLCRCWLFCQLLMWFLCHYFFLRRLYSLKIILKDFLLFLRNVLRLWLALVDISFGVLLRLLVDAERVILTIDLSGFWQVEWVSVESVRSDHILREKVHKRLLVSH